jgi:hypothetical protein
MASPRLTTQTLVALADVRASVTHVFIVPTCVKPQTLRLVADKASREPSAKRQALRSQRNTGPANANATALTLISALHFGQNFQPTGRSAASGGHCEPIATRREYDRIEYGGLPVI